MNIRDKEKTIKSILKYFSWEGSEMLFPVTYGENASIKLEDLLAVIKWPEHAK